MQKLALSGVWIWQHPLRRTGKNPNTVTGMDKVPWKSPPQSRVIFLLSPFAGPSSIRDVSSVWRFQQYIFRSERWTISNDLTDRAKVCFSVNVVFLFYLRFSQDIFLAMFKTNRSVQTFLPVSEQSAIKSDAERLDEKRKLGTKTLTNAELGDCDVLRLLIKLSESNLRSWLHGVFSVGIDTCLVCFSRPIGNWWLWERKQWDLPASDRWM